MGGVDTGVKEQIRQMLLTDKADYYDDSLGLLPFRKKLAESLSKQHNVNVQVENIMISHGGIGALTALCLGVLKADDEVILLEPAYPMYKTIIAFSKAKSVIMPAFTMEQNLTGDYRWQLHLDRIEAACNDRTRMIIITNPSNPCGNCLSKQELIALKQLCEARGIYLVVDEVYDDYVFEGDFYSTTELALQSDFVVRIGSFSKNFAMSGWRIGYLVGAARLVAGLAPLQAGTLSCPTVVSQYAGMHALEHKDEIVARHFETVKLSKELACSFFDTLQKQGLITYAKPSAGFYIFFKTRDQDSFDFVMDVLKTVKISMVPGKDFGPNVTSYVRFCFARDPEVVVEGLKRLQTYYTHHRITPETQPTSCSL